MQSGFGLPEGQAHPSGPGQPGAGEYSWEWAELHKLHRKLLLVAAAGAMICALLALTTALPVVALLLFPGWVVVVVMMFSNLMKLRYWPCPRCGKSLQGRGSALGNWVNPFTRKCIHCGLPKWIEDDPNPRLKHELDPFRTDSIFKLGYVKRRP